MNHIVIDLEFDRIDKSFKHNDFYTQFEIIEIGAVKLDENYRLTERFQSFVKPAHVIEISQPVRKLTGIRTEDLAAAPALSDAIKSFSEWAGSTGTYDVWEWSETDEYQFFDEADDKHITTGMDDTVWIDLQAIFNKEAGLSRAVSLENALKWMNIDFTGREHRASDDAYNTAKILQVMKDEEEKAKRFALIKEYICPEPAQTVTTLGDIFSGLLSACTA